MCQYCILPWRAGEMELHSYQLIAWCDCGQIFFHNFYTLGGKTVKIQANICEVIHSELSEYSDSAH